MDTLFTGRHLIRLEAVASTNTFMQEYLKANTLPEGAVVISDQQFDGRGQRGNSWESETGKNLTFSLLLKPVFLPISHQFDLNRITALAIAETLRFFLPDENIRIKWPNDMLVNEKKIGGVLIENSLRDNQIQNSIVGIGLNINQDEFRLSSRAISFVAITGEETEREPVMEKLFEQIEAKYLFARSGHLDEIRKQFDEELFGLNQQLRFNIGGREQEALMCGTTPEGRLKLEVNGKKQEFDLQAVKWLW
jgi:BirA family transcriptional regulator, biotin operon repressor / biotin---[acetyl-CoA-carboxylase] ligase